MQNNKKNKRMTNFSNCLFESIVMEMTVGVNEYNELIYQTARVVTKLCSPKRKRKVNARKKPFENRKWKRKYNIYEGNFLY